MNVFSDIQCRVNEHLNIFTSSHLNIVPSPKQVPTARDTMPTASASATSVCLTKTDSRPRTLAPPSRKPHLAPS